jgi:hypothetical protein
MSFWSDLVDAVSGTLGGEANITNPSGPLVATGAAGVQAGGFITVIEGIWTELRNGKMWRSLGWLLLGVLLMLLGASWWLGPSAARAAPTQVITRGLA